MAELSALVGFQASLGIDELANVLSAVGGDDVVGLDQGHVTAADRDQGREQLKANGWLVADGDGFSLDRRLAWAVAVMAHPSHTLMLTHRLASPLDQSRRVIAFYQLALPVDGNENEMPIVEQIRTGPDRYTLTTHSGQTAMAARIVSLLAPGDFEPGDASSVSVAPKAFEAAIGVGDPDARRESLAAAFTEAGAEEATARRWSTEIVPGQATTVIEGLATAGHHRLSRQDIYLFGDEVMVIGSQSDGQDVLVVPYRTDTLAAAVQSLWARLIEERAGRVEQLVPGRTALGVTPGR